MVHSLLPFTRSSTSDTCTDPRESSPERIPNGSILRIVTHRSGIPSPGSSSCILSWCTVRCLVVGRTTVDLLSETISIIFSWFALGNFYIAFVSLSSRSHVNWLMTTGCPDGTIVILCSGERG